MAGHWLTYLIEAIIIVTWFQVLRNLWRRPDPRALALVAAMYVGVGMSLVVEIANEFVLHGVHYPVSLARIPGSQIPVAVAISSSLYSAGCAWFCSRTGAALRQPLLGLLATAFVLVPATCFALELLVPRSGYMVFFDATSMQHPVAAYVMYLAMVMPSVVLAFLIETWHRRHDTGTGGR